MSAGSLPHMRAGVARRMTFRCTIQRNTASGSDPLGNPATPVWANLATDVACYAWQGAGKGETHTSDIMAALDVWSVIFPVTTDITESDQISILTDGAGTQWNTEPLNIKGVELRQTHLLVLAQEAR